MNESLFFLHTLVTFFFLGVALFLGKETLVAFVATCWLFANFFVSKQIGLFGFEVTASDVYVIGAMIGMSVIQEFFGKKTAYKTMWSSFFIMGVSVVMSFFHLWYTPSAADTMQPLFEKILHPLPRLMIASFIAYFIVAKLQIALFSYLHRFQRISFAVRSFLTTALMIFLDSFLFVAIGLWGMFPSLGDILLLGIVIKLLLTFSMSLFLSLAKHAYSFKKLPDESI